MKTCSVLLILGRGLGGVLGFVGLDYLSKDSLLKGLALLSVFICVIYLMVHYLCLKTSPYMRQYDFEKPATHGSRYDSNEFNWWSHSFSSNNVVSLLMKAPVESTHLWSSWMGSEGVKTLPKVRILMQRIYGTPLMMCENEYTFPNHVTVPLFLP